MPIGDSFSLALKRIKQSSNTDKMKHVKLRENMLWQIIFGIKSEKELILNI